ncbi:unnamed protein product [Cuscuta campestris]|uniref:Uncharacterized protein n=1 Tax=Cuscuta campestris TaxID=132261 RepID=A0A484M0U6_9ASTE|nr:unnamed protein product [Cuscuta campestris]
MDDLRNKMRSFNASMSNVYRGLIKRGIIQESEVNTFLVASGSKSGSKKKLPRPSRTEQPPFEPFSNDSEDSDNSLCSSDDDELDHSIPQWLDPNNATAVSDNGIGVPGYLRSVTRCSSLQVEKTSLPQSHHLESVNPPAISGHRDTDAAFWFSEKKPQIALPPSDLEPVANANWAVGGATENNRNNTQFLKTLEEDHIEQMIEELIHYGTIELCSMGL